MSLTMRDRIQGCLIGAAYGDALGAPTENRTREQIYEKWGYVDKLLKPPPDVFARGNEAGQVTDDFSMAYVTITKILENGGRIDHKTSVDALVEWSGNERFFEQFVGPTSRKFINRLKGIESEEEARFEPVNDNLRASNGAAMKIGPVVLFARGDMETAMEIVKIICMPTHGNRSSLSAAGGVAAAVSSALRGDDLYQVFQYGLQGAEQGGNIGERFGVPVAGPSVLKRMKAAIRIGEMSKEGEYGLGETMDSLRACFDLSGMAADSVPAAFGLIAAARANVNRAMEAAVNIGNDTDTIATIVGGVLGAFWGKDAFSKGVVKQIEAANGYDFGTLAEKIEQCHVTVGE